MEITLIALFSFLIFSVLFLLAFVFYILFVFSVQMLFYGAVFAKSSDEIVERCDELTT